MTAIFLLPSQPRAATATENLSKVIQVRSDYIQRILGIYSFVKNYFVLANKMARAQMTAIFFFCLPSLVRLLLERIYNKVIQVGSAVIKFRACWGTAGFCHLTP